MYRRRTLIQHAAVAASALASPWVMGQSFPAKPVRIVIGYPPGGSTDIIARVFADKMAKSLGQSVIIENKPGAAGQIASAYVAKAEPDGYTLLATNLGPAAVAPALSRKVAYDPIADFTPISLTGIAPLTLSTGATRPYKSAADVVAAAKANPGKLNYATTGTGSFSHVLLELFNQTAGIKAVGVPYKGGAEVNTAAVAGDIDYFVGSPSDIMSLVKAGRIRILAITTGKRSPLLPDLPTVAESGVPGFSADYWNGILAPAKTPPAIVNVLHQSIVEAANDPDVKAKLEASIVTPTHLTPAEFSELLKKEVARWSKVAQDAGISLD